MCFNFEVSADFIFSWSSAIYLLTQKLTTTIPNCNFLMIFSSIQAADAILWLNK